MLVVLLGGKKWRQVYQYLARAMYLLRLKVHHNNHPAVVHRNLMAFVDCIKGACRKGMWQRRLSMHLLKHVYGNLVDIGPNHTFSTLG